MGTLSWNLNGPCGSGAKQGVIRAPRCGLDGFGGCDLAKRRVIKLKTVGIISRCFCFGLDIFLPFFFFCFWVLLLLDLYSQKPLLSFPRASLYMFLGLLKQILVFAALLLDGFGYGKSFYCMVLHSFKKACLCMLVLPWNFFPWLRSFGAPFEKPGLKRSTSTAEASRSTSWCSKVPRGLPLRPADHPLVIAIMGGF